MFFIIIGVFVFAMVGWIIALFLGSEFLEKFRFMRDFIQRSNQFVEWKYDGDRTPGMYNIVLQGQRGFSMLVGFELAIPILGYKGFDYYGFVRSDSSGRVVISTYLGRGKAKFQFFVNCDLGANPVVVSSTNEDQTYFPDVTYPPHWYQRLGFYS